ncbi:MAG: flavodoxin family protein, partial [Thermoplasmata archaeon]
MKALVFDGAREGEETLEPVRAVLEAQLVEAGWVVETLQLREMDIAPCTGCFKCWTKTPGVCVTDDVGREVTRKLVRSDLFVILTPVTFGGYSSEVKKALDRSLGWILPYFTKVQGKVHHKPRYKRYPKFMAIGTVPGRDDELEAIFHDLVDRNAINAHSPRHAAGIV